MKRNIMTLGWKTGCFGIVLSALLLVQGTAQQAMAQVAVGKDAHVAYDESFDYDYSVQSGPTIQDPLEPVNRGIFAFNKQVDRFFLEPVARGYVFIVPEFGRDRVSNVLSNLGEPVNMVNGFVQGDPERGFTAMWRFIINSTLGAAGLFDFAGYNFQLYHREEDFGQSLGVYGWGHGPYLVIPFIGPSSARDLAGRVVDSALYPLNYVEDDAIVYGRIAAEVIDARAANLDVIEDVYRNSLDPYATFRSAYAQRRAALVRNQRVRETD